MVFDRAIVFVPNKVWRTSTLTASITLISEEYGPLYCKLKNIGGRKVSSLRCSRTCHKIPGIVPLRGDAD